jgi:hypothetical protein
MHRAFLPRLLLQGALIHDAVPGRGRRLGGRGGECGSATAVRGNLRSWTVSCLPLPAPCGRQLPDSFAAWVTQERPPASPAQLPLLAAAGHHVARGVKAEAICQPGIRGGR